MEGQLHRTSSIECEPRTLSIDQIQCAREAAMYVVSTRPIEEAMSIFTPPLNFGKGLEPVICAAGDNMDTTVDLNELEYFQDLQPQGMRDVVSAPF
ncbi:Coiled-coil domain-containing protein 18 [Hibiscus syriacus]|uniref:Coiled-coil domain-containing protein 18 n=1 Tax=Hibiscus syriacus TaxID=106335 RepID=A0A6A2ZDH6_HIBSY|nr:Coiled-coil domain-containing protein 18 [Hibiscus syriacus]